MLVSNSEVEKRLNSPLNLVNKKSTFKSPGAMGVFGLNKNRATIEQKEVIKENKEENNSLESFNPFPKAVQPVSDASTTALVSHNQAPPIQEATDKNPNLESLITTSESQIKLGLAHDNALELMNQTLLRLTNEVDNIRPDKLPSVLSAAQKTVEGIRRERTEAAKNNGDRSVHYHFYTPQQKSLSDYGSVIEVEAVIHT